MLPARLIQSLETAIGAIRSAEPVGGGCIANAMRIDAVQGRFFLKWGAPDVAITFRAEAAGLTALRDAATSLVVPRVIDMSDRYLLLEWIEPGARETGFWEAFGRGLAVLHQTAGPAYGFAEDNFIGRTPQQNDWTPRWHDFFRDCRLAPQVHMAREAGLWHAKWNGWFDRLCSRLDDLLPHDPPASILHGDLWSGNVMVDAAGRPVLIDPAVYYGHHEADLAMTELFGGFDARFYAAYAAIASMEPGYAERKEIYNLYHLINHLNLFGEGYASGVERVLKRFGGKRLGVWR